MSKRRRNSAPAPAAVTSPSPESVATESPSTVNWERLCLALLALVPLLVTAWQLLPEFTTPVPASNDLALHWQMVQGASREMAQWRNPLDFWMPQLELGYPQFLYYQNLPHLVVAGVHRLLFGLVELRTVFDGARYLLLIGLPLTVYWSMRRMDFSVRAAAISAAATTLFANRDGYGLEYDGQLWVGRGLFTQLWAEHLSLIAMAGLYRLMRTGRGYAGTTAALAALALSHFIWSYMMAMTGVLLCVLLSTRDTWKANVLRLVIVGALAMAMSAYMLIPFAMSSGSYLAMFPGITSPDLDGSRSLLSALQRLVIDEDRWPILTALALLGGVATFFMRTRAARFALVGTLVWLLLYQLRPTEVNWLGRVLRYDGHLVYRFIGIADVFLLMLVGVGGEWIWRAIVDRQVGRDSEAMIPRAPRSIGALVVATVLLLAILSPAMRDRATFFGRDGRAMTATRAALEADPDLTTVLDTMAAQPGGRAYMGLASNGGKQWRIGPLIRAYDVLKGRGLPAVAPLFQGLSLNADMVVSFRDRDPAQYDLLDVRYVALPSGAPVDGFMTPLARTPRYTVYRVATTGIATYGAVVERRAAGSQLELLRGVEAWSKSAAPVAKQFIRWDFRQPSGPAVPTGACPGGGRTLSERAEAGIIDLVVECQSPSSLILKTTYHPNWRVTVDGTPVRTYMVSPVFIGIDLPAGQHTIAARYTMATVKWILLAFGTLVLAIVCVVRDRFDWLPRRLLAASA
ncbi:YfhO family protein [Gemmatimonas groenlandica]|uniref:YfhO family protein n=1 Tax=Gemmatimonas groenlandica TaxID=2732249 RepID=A0A6M4IRP1_9BACT|nr:YfhO family protein [Gemmatimonas groenlandica]QJR37340.1 YfhO family protein [Gemmatimonas groenlandica]